MRDHDGRENVHCVDPVEFLDGDFFEWVIPAYAGVVDENVDQKLAILAEVFLGGLDDSGCCSVGMAKVSLDCMGLDAVLRGELRAQVCCEFGRGFRGVDGEDRAASGTEVAGN